jgi:hypothetical protein
VSVHSQIHLAHLQAVLHSSIHIHSIFPVVIVSGNISLAPNWLMFLNSSCAGIIHHDLSFANRTNHSDPNHLAYFLRIDIPLIVDELRTFPEYQSLGIQFDYVLYTDTDVLFTNEFNLSVLPLPKVLTLGPEDPKGDEYWYFIHEHNSDAGSFAQNAGLCRFQKLEFYCV